MNKGPLITDISKEIEFAERLANVTEELEDLVDISRGKKRLEEPVISRKDLKIIFKGKRAESGMPKTLLSMFRLLVVKNLIRGRLFPTAYNSGKEIGLSVSTKSKEDLIKASRRLGLGRVVIAKFDPKNVDMRLYNSVTSQGIKQAHRPICFFEAGIFAGFLENIFRKNINIKEVKCRAAGHTYCHFKSGRLNYGPLKSGTLYPAEAYSQENLRLLTSLASHSIAAIENAILFEKTRRQSVIDSLTQIYNHRYFQTRVDVEYKRAQRYNLSITVFMLDVDNFKKFNDRYGHPKGDEVLKTVAKTLVGCLRDVDIVARYGGDEFAIILPQTNDTGATIVAERLRKEVSAKSISVKGKKVNLAISLGGVTLEPTALKRKPSSIVEAADKALLRAKKKGKNNVVLLKKS